MHLPPAGRQPRFRFCSLLKALPVDNASNKLSMTPSCVSDGFISISAFFLASRSFLSRSACSFASFAFSFFSSSSLSLSLSFLASYNPYRNTKRPTVTTTYNKTVLESLQVAEELLQSIFLFVKYVVLGKIGIQTVHFLKHVL